MAHYEPRLRPLGIGDLLDETIRIYRRNFLLFIGIGAVLLVPLAVVRLAIELAAYGVGGMGLSLALSPVVGILSGLAYAAILLATTHAVSEIYLGRRPTVGAAYGAGLRRFGAMVGLGILSGIALGLLSLTIIGMPVAVYLGICWMLSGQLLLLEGLGIRQAMGRSRALVRGHWWKALGVLILIGILQVILQLFFQLPETILGVIFYSEPSRLGFTLTSIFGAVLNAAGQVIVYPISMCGPVLLYYDLRIRKEGFDLELLAREMEGRDGQP